VRKIELLDYATYLADNAGPAPVVGHAMPRFQVLLVGY
jgi:hypothetical protein